MHYSLSFNSVDELRNVDFDFENTRLTIVKANDAGEFAVRVSDPRVNQHDPASWLRDGASITVAVELHQILTRSVDYRWELDRTNPSYLLQDDIEIEFYTLQYTESTRFPGQYDHQSPNCSKILYKNGEIHIEAFRGTDSVYGIKIISTSEHMIYPQACYFNPELLSMGV